jgi:cytochrome P450
LVVALKILHQERILSRKLNVPGPKSYPFIGMLPYFLKHWEIWPRESTRLSKFYGKTWGSVMPNIGPLPVAYLFTHHENNVRHVLRDNFENYVTAALPKVLPEVLGKGIFNVNGDEWKLHRKVISTMFAKNLMRSATSFSAEKMIEVVRLFREEISKKTVNDEHEQGQGFIDVDIQEVFFRLTFDIICKVAFGLDLKSVENEQQHEFALAYNEIVSLSEERINDIFFEIKKCFGFGQREKRIYELDHIIQDFYSRIIRDAQSNSNSNAAPKVFDLFSKYIAYASKSNAAVKNGDLKDLAMNMLLAGKLAFNTPSYEKKDPIIC